MLPNNEGHFSQAISYDKKTHYHREPIPKPSLASYMVIQIVRSYA